MLDSALAGSLRFFRLSIADERQRTEETLNYHVNLQLGYAGQLSRQWDAVRRIMIALRPPWNESPFYQDAGGGRLRLRLADVAAALWRPDLSAISALGAVTGHPSLRRYLEVWSSVEQAPDAENRLELTSVLDLLGVPRAQLLWSVAEAEERTYRGGLATVIAELEKLEPGLSRVAFDEADPWPDQIVGTWHHEGTTRMSDDPTCGVVDRNCRVHGTSNLFVAGSSVFPVSGSTSPTITILQLALRLGDHLRQELSIVPAVRSG